MINLLSKADGFIKVIDLLNKADDYTCLGRCAKTSPHTPGNKCSPAKESKMLGVACDNHTYLGCKPANRFAGELANRRIGKPEPCEPAAARTGARVNRRFEPAVSGLFL